MYILEHLMLFHYRYLREREIIQTPCNQTHTHNNDYDYYSDCEPSRGFVGRACEQFSSSVLHTQDRFPLPSLITFTIKHYNKVLNTEKVIRNDITHHNRHTQRHTCPTNVNRRSVGKSTQWSQRLRGEMIEKAVPGQHTHTL